MISIITPTNNTVYLKELANSIGEQTYQDWEWRILVNGEATLEQVAEAVKELPVDKVFISQTEDLKGVGALKKSLCNSVEGEIILEVDHDDLLVSTALEEVAQTFNNNSEVCFVYSNAAYVRKDWSTYRYGSIYQWEYRPFVYKGHEIEEIVSPESVPQELCYIWFAPDHLRAWRTNDYKEIGGHNDELSVADDHELIIRTYLYGKMLHIDKCLYIYRVHDDNTWLARNSDIQEATVRLFDKYIEILAKKWAERSGLFRIDLCGGISKPEGYVSLGIVSADITMDLNKKWDILKDNSVGVIRAYDAIEHLKDPIHLMNEAYRVLAHGGFLLIMVPSTDGRGAFQDPSHVSFWNQNSFWYYTKSEYNKYLYRRCPVRFQVRRLETVWPSQWHRDNHIPYVWAVLVAIKDKLFHGVMEI